MCQMVLQMSHTAVRQVVPTRLLERIASTPMQLRATRNVSRACSLSDVLVKRLALVSLMKWAKNLVPYYVTPFISNAVAGSRALRLNLA